MIKKSIAFTLAESLLVMGVIGIVATLVVPNLKNNSEDQVYVAKARKVYTEIETAYERAVLKYGDPKDWTKAQTNAHLQEFLNVKKVCTDATCTQSMAICGKNYAILKDGSSFCCGYVYDVINTSDLIVDLDGPQKGYNTEGKDIFRIHIELGNGITTSKIRAFHHTPVSGAAPTNSNYLQWILDYGNMDYNKGCGVAWETKTSCK